MLSRFGLFEFIGLLALGAIIVLGIYSLVTPIDKSHLDDPNAPPVPRVSYMKEQKERAKAEYIADLARKIEIGEKLARLDALSLPVSPSANNGLNNAPHMKFDASLCVNGTMFGRPHRGGWFACADERVLPTSKEKCVVYSYGLGADWSFDDALESEGCEVHGFDPTGLLWRQEMHGKAYSNINYSKQYPSKTKHFHNWGIGVLPKAVYPPGTIPQSWPGLGDPQMSKSNTEDCELRSIEQTMIDLNQWDKGTISILKIDVEGAEWDSLASLFSSKMAMEKMSNGKVKQLLIEFHWDPDSRLLNDRHAQIMNKIRDVGFDPWSITRHEGSDCCLDVSYVWNKKE